MDYLTFHTYIKEKRLIHLCGIGGVSMQALARLLHDLGANVQGSDRDDSPVLDELRAEGIPTFVGHLPAYSADARLVIRTAAVHDDNPEIIGARQKGVPVLERAEAWGLLMSRYREALCVAGTHGKTTTSAMLTSVAKQAGLEPTAMVGGNVPFMGGSLLIGGQGLFVAEACEYQNSFLYFTPTVAVVLNIDRDHLDFFKDTDDILHSFSRFLENVPPGGLAVLNGEDPNCARLKRPEGRQVYTFGSTSAFDVYPQNVVSRNGYYECDVYFRGQLYSSISLLVPGRHNMYNALAAAAASVWLRVPPEAFSKGIGTYTGVHRRFERRGELNGAVIIDDYAHHPGEIAATLDTARAMNPKRLICVFQPHTYSRTVSLLPEFAESLKKADICILTDIYAARETNTFGISSQAISARIPGAVYAPGLTDAAKAVRRLASTGDIVITMGAGNVHQVFELL